MELKLSRETVPAAETIYDGVQEQALEMDYILPDYCPDIFRLIRCDTVPVITDWSVSGDRLTYELMCDIHILYCGEDGSAVQSVDQHRSFTRTVELGRAAEPAEVRLVPKTDNISYRAVNKRRLDMRGSVSVKISVTGQQEQEVVSDASGMNIQLKKAPVKFAAQRINTVKNVRIEEDMELMPAQSDISGVLSRRCMAAECDVKLISGKLLAKGDMQAELLYSGSGGTVEHMSFTLSYSQIIDADGIDDSFECAVTPEVVSCNISASPESGRMIRCEAELRLNCHAVKTATAMIAEDAFSTVYPCTVEMSEIKAEQIPAVYNESFRHSARLADGEAVPQTIYAMWSEPKNINTRIGDDGRSVVISGMLSYSMAAKDNAGMVIMPDREEAFEETIGLPDDISGAHVTAEVSVRETAYDISAEGILSARADISAKLSVYSADSIRAVTDIVIDDSAKKERDGDYAIKLYFGNENESIWDIAKRYSTSVEAVMEENELSGERLENGGMLLIPIVS